MVQTGLPRLSCPNSRSCCLSKRSMHYVRSMPEGQTGWLAGLRDPAVSRALALMHADIAHPWSVEELAREAGLSRSGLAERFNRVIGVAPVHYLTDWRLQVAGRKLSRDPPNRWCEFAEQVGYESEAAFSRAFARRSSELPLLAWRRAG